MSEETRTFALKHYDAVVAEVDRLLEEIEQNIEWEAVDDDRTD